MISASLFNQVNLNVLRNTQPDLQTIRTADDASYISPAIHFWENGVWKTNDSGKQSYVLRTPGYGQFYLFCQLIAGQNALLCLKIIQLLLYALSVVLIYKTLLLLGVSQKWSFWCCLLYGVLPFTSNFVFYTLTEGITPFLVCVYVWLLVRSTVEKQNKFLLLAAIVFGYMLLVRPMLAPLVLGMLTPLFKGHLLHPKTRIAVVLFAIAPIGLWQVRNAFVVGEYVPLHPVYMDDNVNMYRSPHQALGELFKCWGSKPEDFHAVNLYLWEHAQHQFEDSDIRTLLSYLPQHVHQFPVDTVFSHMKVLYTQFKQLAPTKPIPKKLLAYELQVTNEIAKLTNAYKSQHFLRTYVVSPLQSFKRLTLHSNLSLHIFQHSWRGHLLMEFLRWICFFMHVGIVIIPLLFLFHWRWKYYPLLVLAPFSYIFYLSFFQVMNEERYLLPFLPILFIGSMVVCAHYRAIISQRTTGNAEEIN